MRRQDISAKNMAFLLGRFFSSHDIRDVRNIMLATGKIGSDVILNSSNGNMMHEICRCITPRGRFIDIGRVDVQRHSTMAMEIFSQNATFSSFDVSIMAVKDPQFCSSLMKEVGSMLRQGIINPISPITEFNFSELGQALLYFSKGQHIGKIVAAYEEFTTMVKMLPPPPHAIFDSEAVYILAGGLGGLGRSILRWMVDRGARYLTVLSRSGTQNLQGEASVMISELSAQNVRIDVQTCDVTVKEELLEVVRLTSKEKEVRGIVHAAAIISDRLFDTLPYSQWQGGLAAKVQGTLNLHHASIQLRLPLDFFIMTSSFEAVVAMPTQAAYCAANCFQDAFARFRISQGLPACSIAFGLITEIGDFGQRSITRNMIHRNGLYPTGELEFLELIKSAFLEPPSCSSTWRTYDPLAESQITTCLEPARLATMEQVQTLGMAEAPRWYSDRKFSHLIQAMVDELILEKPSEPKVETAAITIAIDAAIERGDLE